jgi:hypothetical protein
MAKKGNVAKYVDVIGNGQELHTEYKQYETQFVHRAHEELYSLLAKIMEYVQGVLNRTDCEAAISAVRKQLKDEHNIKTTSKTGNIGVLLRLVLLDAHKKTLFTYKRTIQLAIDAGIQAADLADFIKRSNGIDQLSKSTEAKALANERTVRLNDERILATYYLMACDEMRRIGSVAINPQYDSYFYDSKNSDGIVYAACTHSNGQLHILEFVNTNEDMHCKMLNTAYEKAFDKIGHMSDERKMLIKRALVLNEAQCVMPNSIPLDTTIQFKKAA